VGVEAVMAIRVAPFKRYATVDVMGAVADAGREGEIALFTGNDDNIVSDLLTTYRFPRGREVVSLRMAGGLLGARCRVRRVIGWA
jgi:hypothetical protein